MTTVTVLGLGEAGSIYAAGFAAAGADVRAFDPVVTTDIPGVSRVGSIAGAVAGAECVVSLVGASAAPTVAEEALAAMDGGVYADFNTATPAVKADIARRAAERVMLMADVAVLAPVPRAGISTGLLVSGAGAPRVAELLSPFGAPIQTIDAPAGEAARLKLLRSVFMKGLAALVVEGLTAAEAAGADDWLRIQIADELGPDGASLLDRLVDGTYRHAERRLHEMRDALAGLEAVGASADMTRATVVWLERIVAAASEHASPPRS